MNPVSKVLLSIWFGFVASYTAAPKARAAAVEGRLAVGEFHTCAVVKGGKVKCWGLGEQGQLGNGKLSSSASPVAVAGLTGVASISAGYHWTCALHKDGKVSCWGYTDGRWGASGDKKNLVKCWEKASDKKKGIPGFDCAVKPIAVAGVTAKHVRVNGSVACAVKKDDAVTCWTKDKEISKKVSLDYPELKGATDVQAVAIQYGNGKGHGCALIGGKVHCWANNVNESAKVKDFDAIGGFTDVARIQMSKTNSGIYASKADGTVLFAGGGILQDAAPKSLGTGNTVGSDKPKALPELKGMLKIGEAPYHGCGLYADGGIKCWGTSGGIGRLGDGKAKSASRTPVAVSDIEDAVDIGVGYDHSCAALASGEIVCWGDNTSGKTGKAKGKASLKPTEVPGIAQ